MPEAGYRRIAEILRQRIEAGVLGPGDQLPTEAELSASERVSRSTIRAAIQVLTDLGLVHARPGQGTFVRETGVPFVTDLSARGPTATDTQLYTIEARAQHREPSTSQPLVEVHRAAGRIAAALEVVAGSQIVSRHQQRYIDDQPYSLQTSFYSMNLAAQATRLLEAIDIAEGTMEYLRLAFGIREEGSAEVISARVPDSNEADFFSLPEDGRIAIIEHHQISYDRDGQPIRLTITVYPADRNQFVLNVTSVRNDQQG